jgi:hypothetical protein
MGLTNILTSIAGSFCAMHNETDRSRAAQLLRKVADYTKMKEADERLAEKIRRSKTQSTATAKTTAKSASRGAAPAF